MGLVSRGTRKEIKEFLQNNHHKINQEVRIWLTTSSKIDIFLKQYFYKSEFNIQDTNLSEKQIEWVNILYSNNQIKKNLMLIFLKMLIQESLN